MQCWVCGAPANGICRFCGRAVCRTDAKRHVFVLEIYESGGTHYGLALEDALHCGICKPKPDPVLMDFLEVAAPVGREARDGDERHSARVPSVTARSARRSNVGPIKPAGGKQMTKAVLEQVIQRASTDSRFRDALGDNFEAAVRPYELSDDEKAQLAKGMGLRTGEATSMAASTEAQSAIAETAIAETAVAETAIAESADA